MITIFTSSGAGRWNRGTGRLSLPTQMVIALGPDWIEMVLDHAGGLEPLTISIYPPKQEPLILIQKA